VPEAGTPRGRAVAGPDARNVTATAYPPRFAGDPPWTPDVVPVAIGARAPLGRVATAGGPSQPDALADARADRVRRCSIPLRARGQFTDSARTPLRARGVSDALRTGDPLRGSRARRSPAISGSPAPAPASAAPRVAAWPGPSYDAATKRVGRQVAKTGSLRSRLVEFSQRKIPLHASLLEERSHDGQPDRFPTSGEAWRAGTPRPPRPDGAGRAGGDGVAGDGVPRRARRPEVAGEGALVVHTAVRNVRQAGPVAVREIGRLRRPPASCDGSFCPVLSRGLRPVAHGTRERTVRTEGSASGRSGVSSSISLDRSTRAAVRRTR
jgi:hypothetical protein